MILLFKIFQYSNHINPYTKSEGLGIRLIVFNVAVELRNFPFYQAAMKKDRIIESYF